MALSNPRGRANYEPNSWGDEGGPREDREIGFASHPVEERGVKRRARAELFADHYSQARQFYVSQTDVEREHIANALTFELSKVETLAIRTRVVAHLMNIDGQLARIVARGLGLRDLPAAATPARAPIDLEPSPALSMLANAPNTFQGRKLGILVTEGVDAALFQELVRVFQAEGAVCEVIAPAVGGVIASDGALIEGKQQLDGGPSVLYDAVALLISEKSAEVLLSMPAARDFAADAYAHFKYVGYTPAAVPLLAKAGVPPALDAGYVPLHAAADAARLLQACRALRYWQR